MNTPDTIPALITVRRLCNATNFLLIDKNGCIIAQFKKGLMEGVTFDTTSPNLTIREEGKPTRISTGALVGTKLQFGDEKMFGMPSSVVVTAIIRYHPRERCFFNSTTGNRVDSADYAVLDEGLVTAGWINRI